MALAVLSLLGGSESDEFPKRVLYAAMLTLGGLLSEALRMYDTALRKHHKIVFKHLPPLEHTDSAVDLSESSSSHVLNKLRVFQFLVCALPVVLFLQATMVWLINCIQESQHSYLLPYTTLCGLSTGFLFNTALRPFTLMGMTAFFRKYRYQFCSHEWVAFLFLPLAIRTDTSVYYYMTSSFWSGYNICEAVTDALTALIHTLLVISPPLTVRRKLTSHQFSDLNSLVVRLRDKLAQLMFALLLLGFSVILLVYVDETAFSLRTIFAQLLGAIGCYLLTFPVGSYIGNRIPSHQHPLTLGVCTYLLIPLATADLSVLHLIGLLGAGLLGGIASHIFDKTYIGQLEAMNTQYEALVQLRDQAPLLFDQLTLLPLPEDKMMVETRRGREVG